MSNLASYAQSGGNGGIGIVEILGFIGLWMMFTKAGEQGWKGVIPIYNMYTLCNLVMGDSKYFIRMLIGLFIPVVGWCYSVYCAYKIAEATALAYGKTDGWKWGYLFLGGIFYFITGLDSSSYYGPMGFNDARSGSARTARTVNFDVVSNDADTGSDDVVFESTTTTVEEFNQPGARSAYTGYASSGTADAVGSDESVVDFSFDESGE